MRKTVPLLTKYCFKLRRYINRRANRRIAEYENGITIISQNCIGGVVYNFYGMKFCSPLINMYIEADDFVKLVNNQQYYLNLDPILIDDTHYPLCALGDITLHCLHYKSFNEVLDKWKARKARINWDKILIIMTDRDGFCERHYEEFDKFPGNKLLLTSRKRNDIRGVYTMRGFRNMPSIGTLSDFSNIFGKKYFMEIDFTRILHSIIDES